MKIEKQYTHLLENVKIFVELTNRIAELENENETIKVYKLLAKEDFFKEMSKHLKS